MSPPQRDGFSLVEMLVVFGVLGVIAGLILPAVQQMRGSASRTNCANAMKQIGLALHNYHDTRGAFPPIPARPRTAGDPNQILGWMALILPQMGQESLYQTSVQACHADRWPLNDPPHVGLATVVKDFVCHADGRLTTALTDDYGVQAAYTSYIGIGGAVLPGAKRGLPGVLYSGGGLLAVTDGTSQTIMLGERPPSDSLQAGWWYPGIWMYPKSYGFQGPNNVLVFGAGKVYLETDNCAVTRAFGPGSLSNRCDRYHLWSLHGGGANFGFADGTVRFLSYSADVIIPALATRSGGEPVAVPD